MSITLSACYSPEMFSSELLSKLPHLFGPVNPPVASQMVLPNFLFSSDFEVGGGAHRLLVIFGKIAWSRTLALCLSMTMSQFRVLTIVVLLV